MHGYVIPHHGTTLQLPIHRDEPILLYMHGHALLVGARRCDQLREGSGAFREVAGAACLHEAAVGEHEQLVAVRDGVHAVRDHQHDALHGYVIPLHRVAQRGLNDAVGRPAQPPA